MVYIISYCSIRKCSTCLQIGRFYSIIGISLGFNNSTTAAYFGLWATFTTGTVLGATLGAIGIRWKKIRMLNPYKSSLVGIGAGLVIWLILFLPITVLLIQPSNQRIVVILAVSLQKPILSENLSHSTTNIALMAIIYHMIWGAIFGFVMSSLLRIREFKIKQHYVDIINIDPEYQVSYYM